jgi:hypothetical protein
MQRQIVADESEDFRIVIVLRAAGIFVNSIAEEIPSKTDKSIFSIAREKQALLIT